MCKPGSASGGSGLTSGGLGIAFVVVGIAGVVSMATAFISTIITAALITVFSLAAAGVVVLVVILCRTRSVVTWPMRPTLSSTAGRPAAPTPAPRRVRAAPSLPSRPLVRPVTGAAARPAVAARKPLAIEAPTPVLARIGVPVGPGDLAMVGWPPATAPGTVHGDPEPEEAGVLTGATGWPGRRG